MFYDAKAFNQPINFNSLKLTNVNGMFLGASKFNQVCNLITSSVIMSILSNSIGVKT